MSQAVSCRPFTVEVWVLLRATCEICSEQSVSETGLYPNTWVFFCHYHSTKAPCLSAAYCFLHLSDEYTPANETWNHFVSDMQEHRTENYCHFIFVVCQLRVKAAERCDIYFERIFASMPLIRLTCCLGKLYLDSSFTFTQITQVTS